MLALITNLKSKSSRSEDFQAGEQKLYPSDKISNELKNLYLTLKSNDTRQKKVIQKPARKQKPPKYISINLECTIQKECTASSKENARSIGKSIIRSVKSSRKNSNAGIKIENTQ